MPPAAVLMVQRFVPNRGNGWTVTLDALHDYFAATDRDRRSDASPHQLTEDLRLPELLGRRTGELHLQFASANGGDLTAEPNSTKDLQRTAAMMRARGEDQLRLLERSLRQLSGEVHRHAEQVLAGGETLLGRFEELAQLADGGLSIRCHGDYHLGQTLVTEDDILILDFEGEPARSLEERRAKSSPAKDVAGMLRSFSYAAASGLRTAIEEGQKSADALALRADEWERAAHDAFLHSYLKITARSSILPAAAAALDTLLRAFVIDKALYELGYELNNRPDWVDIPLTALLRLSGTDAPWRRS
jgi:maltose alpha-D-glucosyltransferase/alpha-amylase